MTILNSESGRSDRRGKRVLMLLENSAYSEDGRVRCEANSLTSAGYEVTIIGQAADRERWYEEFEGVRAYQFPPPIQAHGLLGYLLEYSYTMSVIGLLSAWIAVRRGFDVIHAHNPPDFLVLIGGFWKLFGKRFIFDQHDLSPDMYLSRFASSGGGVLHRTLLFFERLSCRWADHIIVTNESGKRLQMERSGVPAARFTIVRNGPEPWHLDPIDPDPSLRGSEPNVIGYVGMMGPQDGIDYLLRALQILKRDLHRTDWRCILIGKGAEMEPLRDLAATLDISDHVHFTGWVDYEKVPRYLAATDICAVPDPSNEYNDRSTIVKLMEYMAQAKPVVAFDLPEHRVTAGDTALYAKPNDEREFAEQILRLMDNPELRQELGTKGRQRVVEQLTWARQETYLLDAYRRLSADAPERKRGTGERRELAAAQR
jgi:glycosyltransferase involved in cell wall biosynthesis